MLPAVPETVARSADKFPEREALVFPEPGVRLTFEELDRRATRFSNGLRSMGVSKGDVVSVMLRNSVPMVVAIVGITRAGAVFNPINFRIAAGEARYVFEDSGADYAMYSEGTRDVVEAALEDVGGVEGRIYTDDDVNPVPDRTTGYHELLAGADETAPDVDVTWEDPWAILYTSGTTGQPKGVVHTHGDATYHNLVMAREYVDREVSIITNPLYHSAGLNVALLPFLNLGAKAIVLQEFDAERILRLIDEEGVTAMSLPSRTWREILEGVRSDNVDGSSLRSIRYGSSAMPRPLLEDLIDEFGENVSTSYGMTEMGPVVTTIWAEDVADKLGSVGRPLPNHDVRIVTPTAAESPDDRVTPDDTLEPGEEGEIIVSGPCMMQEYLNDPEQTDLAIRDGWFFTGDIGYLDEDGFLFLVDRVDDMIISGGENIYPNEVEDVLYEHDLVEDVAVVGVDDDRWGEAVTAFVVPADDADAAELEEALDEYCLESDDLADFKRPRRYAVVAELPRNPSGKILRYELRERATE